MRDLYYPTRQAIPASIFQQIRALTLPTLGVSRCCTLLQGATGATREISDLAIHLGVAQPLHWLVFITAAGTGRTPATRKSKSGHLKENPAEAGLKVSNSVQPKSPMRGDGTPNPTRLQIQ
jgi:hypothetical protein